MMLKNWEFGTWGLPYYQMYSDEYGETEAKCIALVDIKFHSIPNPTSSMLHCDLYIFNLQKNICDGWYTNGGDGLVYASLTNDLCMGAARLCGRKVGMGARVMVWVASYWPSILCPCHSYQVHPYPSCNIWSSLRILALHDDASGCNRNLTLTTSGLFTYYVICQWVSHSQPLPLVTNCTTPLSFPHHWKDESSIITRLERGFGQEVVGQHKTLRPSCVIFGRYLYVGNVDEIFILICIRIFAWTAYSRMHGHP